MIYPSSATNQPKLRVRVREFEQLSFENLNDHRPKRWTNEHRTFVGPTELACDRFVSLAPQLRSTDNQLASSRLAVREVGKDGELSNAPHARMIGTSENRPDSRPGAISQGARWPHVTDWQLRIAAWMAVAAYVIGFAVSAAYRTQSDFTIYRNAGLAAAAGKPIYDFRDWSPFQYAPIYAVIFIPFGWISRRPAQLMWFAISMAAALPAMIVGTYRMLLGPDFEWRSEMIAVPLLMIARFLHPNFDHGQINIVVVAMIVWGLAFAYESKPAQAGFLLAASLLIKPLALPAVAYLVFQRRFAVVLSMLAFYVALLCLPALFLDLRPAIHQTIDYFNSLITRVPLDRLSHDLLSTYNQSASAIAVRVFSPAKMGIGLMGEARAAALGFVVNLAFAGWTIWKIASARGRSPGYHGVGMSAVFCFIPSFAPLSWLEYYVALEIPYAALVAELSSEESDLNRSKVIYAVLAGTFLLNVGSRFVGAGLYIGVPYFCSLVILWTLLGSRELACSTMSPDQRADVAWAS